jgi:magnesium chelatase family protein
VDRYLSRVSGPRLDRIDIHLHVPAVAWRDLTGVQLAEPSAAVRARVEAARRIQRERFREEPGVFANAHMSPRALRKHCRISAPVEALLKTAVTKLGLSARAYHRILKISRTIADLAGAEELEAIHVSEAIQYRSLDRKKG